MKLIMAIGEMSWYVHALHPNDRRYVSSQKLCVAQVTKGYAVVEGAIPRHEALAIRSEIYDWMESFPMGFKRDDPATFTNEHMPIHIKGGMLHGYGIAHEDWAWKIRSAPGVVDAFAHVWGTPELVTSYDSAAVMLPHRKDIPKDVSSGIDPGGNKDVTGLSSLAIAKQAMAPYGPVRLQEGYACSAGHRESQ